MTHSQPRDFRPERLFFPLDLGLTSRFPPVRRMSAEVTFGMGSEAFGTETRLRAECFAAHHVVIPAVEHSTGVKTGG